MIDIIVMLLFAAGVAAYMFPKFIKMYSTSKDLAERMLLIIGIATTVIGIAGWFLIEDAPGLKPSTQPIGQVTVNGDACQRKHKAPQEAAHQ